MRYSCIAALVCDHTDEFIFTSWGESAGAISVALHMLTNDGNTEGLFRAGIMSSGSLVPTGDITDLQGTYDFVVDQVGCSGSSDTLACLRTVPADDLVAAANKTPGLTSYSVCFMSYFASHSDSRNPTSHRASLYRICRVQTVSSSKSPSRSWRAKERSPRSRSSWVRDLHDASGVVAQSYDRRCEG